VISILRIPTLKLCRLETKILSISSLAKSYSASMPPCRAPALAACLLLLLLPHRAAAAAAVSYRAAACQYKAFGRWDAGGAAGILAANLETIADLAGRAGRQGADILVLPEYGLIGNSHGPSADDFKQLLQYVPDPGDGRVPCDEPLRSHGEAVATLSCLARTAGLYLVASVGELVDGGSRDERSADFTAYNTLAVFDRDGRVVARYRKLHLYGESSMAPGPPDYHTALFDTDFGVKFSLQICMDILYATPAIHNIETAGVRDVAMATEWFDERPFLTSMQMYSGWSRGLGVNLIVSNQYQPELGGMGSGVFRGSGSADYTYNTSVQGAVLIVANVSTTATARDDLRGFAASIRKRIAASSNASLYNGAPGSNTGRQLPTKVSQNFCKNRRCSDAFRRRISRRSRSMSMKQNASSKRFQRHYNPKQEDLSTYSSVLLQQNITEGEIKTVEQCDVDSFCCQAIYSSSKHDTNESPGAYRLLVKNGIVTEDGLYYIWTQTCGVTFCTAADDVNSCGSVGNTDARTTLRLHHLSGDFDTPYVYPSALSLSGELASEAAWAYTVNGTQRAIEADGLQNILSTTLYGRWFEKDE